MAEQGRQTNVKVAVIIAMYWTLSISMVFIMKHLLTGSFGNLDVTVFVTWYQSASAVIVVMLVSMVVRVLRLKINVPSLKKETVFSSEMLSLSFTFVFSLAMNNLLLKHINVSFYQIARSLTLIFSVLLSMCMLQKKPGFHVMIACLLIVSGFVIGVEQEEASGTITVWGIVYGIFSSFSAALCGIYFKQGEKIVNSSALKLAYVNNFNSMIIIFPLVISTNQFSHVLHSEFLTDTRLWFILTISGVLNLAIGWVSALQISYTSPVTHQVSINAKSIAQTVLAIAWNAETKTFTWWVGNFLVILGIGFYTYVKLQEDKVKVTTSPATKVDHKLHHSENMSIKM